MARMIFGILLGLLTAGLVLAASVYGFGELHRFPAPADYTTAETLAEYAAATPGSAIACVLGGLCLAGLLGGWAAALVAGQQGGAAALGIGATLTACVIVYATLIPNPAWITVVGVLLPLPFSVLAAITTLRHVPLPSVA